MGLSDQIHLPIVKSIWPRSFSSTPTIFFPSKIDNERMTLSFIIGALNDPFMTPAGSKNEAVGISDQIHLPNVKSN